MHNNMNYNIPLHPENPDKSNTPKKENTVVSSLHDLVFLIAGVLLVFSLLFRVVVVSGGSMNDTLVDGDWLFLVGNVLYREPKPGDIIVASKDSFEDGAPIIKRVIATEGQEVNIIDGVVYVDGQALSEDYTLDPPSVYPYASVSFPLIVEEGCVFVMGDNRNNSTDSRSPRIGLIDKREIMGRAVFLIIPGNGNDASKREFSRIGVLP